MILQFNKTLKKLQNSFMFYQLAIEGQVEFMVKMN